MAKKVQLQTNGKEWQMVDGEQVLVDVPKQDIDPITSSSCVQIEGFRTLEEAVSDNKMLSQDLTYTKVMDKVGGDYHQNVLDGQYSKAILYGNTQVNLCEENTSVRLQIPTTFTSFNNGELQIDNKENEVVAPLIKGVTMVNLAQTNSASLDSSESVVIENVKGNTLYTLSFKFTTKNTNSGVTIESYNGDTYLEDTMHKTGLGDVAKFTFTTHTNATVVKVVNNAAYGGQTIQLDDIMLIEGDQTALDIPFFRGMKSVELVRPLTNLFTDSMGMLEAGATATNSSGNVTVTSKSSSSWAAISYQMSMLKNNTKYLVMWDSLTTTQTSTSNTKHLISVYYVGTNSQAIGTMNNNSLCPTKRSLIFDTKDFDVNKVWLKIHATLNNTETGTTTVTGLRVFEYDDYLRSVDLQSIGWFSGTKNVAVEPIKTCSKNLYPYGDINFTPVNGQVWHDGKGKAGMTGDIASKSQTRFLLRKGNYIISSSSLVNCGMQVVGDKEEILTNGVQSGANATFILDKDTYCTVRFKSFEANVACTSTNIQIERGATATNYVAHDSRYYEPDGQNAIVLRSLPDGVCDTFNLQTGEYIQRIGEAVLDGDEDIVKGIDDTDYVNTIEFYINRVVNAGSNKNSICDSYIYKYKNEDTEHFYTDNKRVVVFIQKTKLSSQDVDGFKQYLQQNPVTVQYELATPITTIIPRTIRRNNNGTVSTIDFGTYTNKESLVLSKNPSYLTINSMTSIKPVVEPITYIDFKTRLKTNTDYSVIIDKDSTDKTINLGGTSKTYADKMLVRTPSINLEQNLRISGSGSIQNIMVIEGDVLNKELPYFNGICNVKMPIVKNIGKNLFNPNIIGDSGQYIRNDTGSLINDITSKYTVGYMCVKPNTKYYLYVKGLQRVYFLDNNKKWISRTNPLYQGGTQTHTINTNFTTSSNCHYIQIQYRVDELDLTNATLVEYGDNNPHVEYKENSIYIAQGEIGLSQDMFEQGGISSYPSAGTVKTYDSCKSDSGLRIRSKALFKINGGSTYRIRFLDSDKRYQYYLWDASGNSLGITGGWSEIAKDQIQTINTPIEAKYMSLMFKKGNNNANISVSEFKQELFQLLELDSTVQIRSLPNGVKDELNLLTGEYIQRIGEVVLNGSEEWGLNKPLDNGSFNQFAIYRVQAKKVIGQLVACDKLISDSNENENNVIWIYDGTTIVIHSSCTSKDEFKTWLQQNPITVQYELAEPIISYPRIVSNAQEREVGVKLPNGVCDTYNPSTGITVKRIGKVVLDGSENWLIDAGYTPTANLIRMSIKQPDKKLQYNNGDLVCDKLPVVQQGVVPCIYDRWNEYLYIDVTSSNIGVTFGTDDNATIISKFKTWLNANPLTVYYELKNPIVTTDIVLPNGVHDDYNPITGLYTKRVGLTEFDGSDDEGWEMQSVVELTNTAMFTVSSQYHDTSLCTGICDKFAFKFNWTVDEEGCYLDANGKFCLRVAKSKLTTVDLYGFKTYLSQNPIKLWYALQMSQKIQLTPYFGLPMPYAYKDGYLIMDSAYEGQTLPPEITYQLTVNRTGQITQNNIKLKEHTARLSNLEYILIEATLDSIFSREMQNFELELMNIELPSLDE